MSRRRYVSTEISIDKNVNKLAREHGDFAALLYTWMIPHAEDNCEITGDPEELLSIVCPGRRDKSERDIEEALHGMTDLKLVVPFVRNGKPMLLFPPENFYKYQTYISRSNRNNSTVEQRETKENAEERRETPEKAVSPSPSPSPSLSLSLSPLEDEEVPHAHEEEIEEDMFKEQAIGNVFKFFNKNIGPITPFQTDTISQYLDDGLSPDMIIAVLKDSIGKDDKWSWAKKVLGNSFDQNIKTVELYEAKKVERASAKSRDKPMNKGNSSPPQKGNFEQRKYDDAYYDKLYKDV